MPSDDDLARRLRAEADRAAGPADDPALADELIAAKRRGHHRQHRSRLVAGGAALAVVAVVGVAVLRPGTSEDGSTLRTADTTPSSALEVPAPDGDPIDVDDEPATPTAEGWSEIAASPLSARLGASATWTGSEVLVIGGSENLCPPLASCVASHLPLLDGAAYDPGADRWRSIAPAPEAVASSPGMVVDGTAVFATQSSLGTILTYDIGGDRWTALTRADQTVASTGAPFLPVGRFGDRVLLATQRTGPSELALLDVTTGEVEALPPPPLPSLYSAGAVTNGDQVFLFGNELVPNPGAERPNVIIGARFDEATGWTRLPDSEILGDGPILSVGGVLVDASPGSADGGQVGNWGRSYPNGGIFDPPTATWRDLPPDRPTGVWAAGWPEGAAGDQILTRDGLLLDPVAGTWLVVPTPPGANDRRQAAAVWAGDRLIVWGGESWLDPDGALLGSGASFRPPP